MGWNEMSTLPWLANTSSLHQFLRGTKFQCIFWHHVTDQEHLYPVAMYWIHIHLYNCTSITYYIYIYVHLHKLDLTYIYIYIHRVALSLKLPYSKKLPSQKETHIQSTTYLCSRKGMHRWCCLFQTSQEKAAWTTNIKIGWAYWCQEVIFMLLSNE